MMRHVDDRFLLSPVQYHDLKYVHQQEENTMAKVTKWNGTSEPFDREKIVASIRKSGMDATAARTIANMVPERDVTTAELRKTITNHIRSHDPEAADRYEGTLRLALRKSVETAKGVARITENALNRMKVKVGDTIDLMHGDRRHTVRVEADNDLKEREIHLHEEDLQSIGADEGSRITTSRRK